jgi:hypothetical protein
VQNLRRAGEVGSERVPARRPLLRRASSLWWWIVMVPFFKNIILNLRAAGSAAIMIVCETMLLPLQRPL